MPRTVRPPFKLRIKLREELQKFTQTAANAQGELQKKEGDLLAPIVEKMKNCNFL